MSPVGLGIGVGIGAGGRAAAAAAWSPTDVADLAFFFDSRDALASGGNLTSWPDITGTWALTPAVGDGSIKVKTNHANGVQCVEIQGRSDRLVASLTGAGQVYVDSAFSFGTVFATRSNNIDGFMELGDEFGAGAVHRLNGFTAERAYIVGASSPTRDVALTDDKAAHHKVIFRDGSSNFRLRNHENSSGSTFAPAITAAPATQLVLGGAPSLSVTYAGDGYYWSLWAVKRNLIGHDDLAAIDGHVETNFNCAGLASLV